VRTVAEALEETGLDAKYLELELTESMVMHDAAQLVAMLGELKRLGVHISVDDFGTGYSSLSYLKRFPVDRLKVDRSFVEEIGFEENDQSVLTASIIELAGSLNLRPVAEGVEREDQLARLLAMRCEFGQGFLFARPLDRDRLRAVLSETEVPAPTQ
jgi:EAL domain-containing protein (putative c-di-GMP-specific phosphodiesterase class I)